jgi:tRNA threonylcarbamoyladenosine modification (KEOPS) complex Cgi121 subunit
MVSGSVEGAEYSFGAVSLPDGWTFPASACTVQLVDPARVYGELHLLFSIYSHLKGFRLAKDASVDLLLRILGTHKINEAMAAKPKNAAVLVVLGPGAKTEYARIVKVLGANDTGALASRDGELDAIERCALLGV